ncbi:MAG TPA: hypothetical protein VGC66_24460 [Pyrinomonadaceae bacterium]|jgi:hypothetical protein
MKALPTLTVLFSLILLPSHLSSVNNLFSSGSPGAGQSSFTSNATEEVSTIAFCEMVKNPRLYFDKPVRLTATLQLATEASYLSDEKCPLSHDDQIGVRYASSDETQRNLLNSEVNKIRSIEYGSRAKVTVVGILRNSSLRSFAWYRYRFDLTRFEDISQVIVPYEGTLQGGITYRAVVRGDGSSGLSLIIPLRTQEHIAVRIEWTNLSEFPVLERLRNASSEQQIVFTVIADQTRQMTERRWNRTLECKIISIN